uniref:Uncharacterized protein n=1 Tax=Amphimedon queenslandica TaxID=400682 RepID=A0A1X7THQ2_AMPQE
YNKVLKQEYVFGKELHDIPKLSMMDTIISLTGFDKDESSSFIHTTLQEYLAAIYLVNNPDSMFITNEDLEQNSNLEAVLTFYVGLMKFIDREVDNKTIDTIFNHVDNIQVTGTSRSLYADFTGFFFRFDLNANADINIAITRDFEYFICGYIISAHNITLKLEPYSSSEIIAFNKGLQSHSSVNGKIQITLHDFNFRVDSDLSMITEVLALP